MAEQRTGSRRRHRWPKRLLVGLLVLLGVLVIVVQIFLWTDYPRRIAIAQIQKKLGVQAKIKSLSISWSGRTRAEDVTISVPMTGGPLLQAKSVSIRHTSLPLIAFSQDVKKLTIDGLEVDLREQHDGKWNVQQLSPQKKEEEKPRSSLDLPVVEIRGAVVRLIKRDGREAEIRDISVTAHQAKPLEYSLKADVGDFVHANGKMSLTGELQHELALKIASVPDGLESFTGKLPQPLSGELKWSGRRYPHGITGTLELHGGAFSTFHAAGAGTLFTTAEHTLVFEPNGFNVQTAGETPFSVVLQQGKIVVGERIKLEQLRGKMGDGRVALDGWLKPATFDGSLEVAWEQVNRAKLMTTGRLNVQTKREFTGKLLLDGHTSSSIELEAGRTTAELKFHAEANPDRSLLVTFETMPLAWTRPNGATIAVPSVVGDIRSSGQKLVLHSLRPRDPAHGELRAWGELDAKERTWWASLDCHQLDLGNMKVKAIRYPIDLNVSATGTHTRVDMKQLYLRHGSTVVWSNGFFDASIPEPVNVNAWVWYEPVEDSEDDAEFTGMNAYAAIAGTLEPQNLHAKGVVAAKDLAIAGFKVGDVSIDLQAEKTDDVARIRSRDIDLLGGTWALRGDWHAFSDQPLKVNAWWKNVPLDQVGDLVKVKGMQGMVESGQATFLLPSVRLKDATMQARMTARDVKFQTLQAKSADVDAELVRGTFVATTRLKEGEGQIDSTLTLDLPKVRQIKLESKIGNWSAPTFGTAEWMKDLKGMLNGNVTATFVRPDRRLDVDTTISGQIKRADKVVGEVDLHAAMANSSLEIKRANVTTLDGRATAKGRVDLNKLNGAQLEVYFSRLLPSELAWIQPELADVSGRFTGSLLIHPSPFKRDLEPLEILLTVRPEDARFRTIDLGPINLAAYANYTSPNDFRIVTDLAEFSIADGMVKPFARLSSEPSRGLSQLLTADLHGLDLETIVRAFKNDGKPVVGRVGGRINVYGATTSVAGISGEALMKLSESDLGNFGPIAVLYNAMHVGSVDEAPRGTGGISLRLEQSTLTIVNATYFNRGVWVNGFGKIDEIDKEGKNDYTVIGSARPLKDISLPLIGDVDAFLSALQTGITAVYVEGPLRHPQSHQVMLSELSDSMRAIVLGKAKEDR